MKQLLRITERIRGQMLRAEIPLGEPVI